MTMLTEKELNKINGGSFMTEEDRNKAGEYMRAVGYHENWSLQNIYPVMEKFAQFDNDYEQHTYEDFIQALKAEGNYFSL